MRRLRTFSSPGHLCQGVFHVRVKSYPGVLSQLTSSPNLEFIQAEFTCNINMNTMISCRAHLPPCIKFYDRRRQCTFGNIHTSMSAAVFLRWREPTTFIAHALVFTVCNWRLAPPYVVCVALICKKSLPLTCGDVENRNKQSVCAPYKVHIDCVVLLASTERHGTEHCKGYLHSM